MVIPKRAVDPLLLSYRGRILDEMARGNPSPKLATVDPDIHERVVTAAAEQGASVSAWMTISSEAHKSPSLI